MTRRKIVTGNWKMNGLAASRVELEALMTQGASHCDVIVCPPATLVATFAERASGSPIIIGGQDCHAAPSGAHTGDIAAEMLADAGAGAVILGHSERRTDHGEADADVRAKAQAALRAKLIAIICCGETEDERDSGETLSVVSRQLADSIPDDATAANTVIAYEPVWAIGSGRVPGIDEIATVHAFIRAALVKRFGVAGDGMRILYGGSVKPGNAAELFGVANVDGALVGGASLSARDFSQIIDAANQH